MGGDASRYRERAVQAENHVVGDVNPLAEESSPGGGVGAYREGAVRCERVDPGDHIGIEGQRVRGLVWRSVETVHIERDLARRDPAAQRRADPRTVADEHAAADD